MSRYYRTDDDRELEAEPPVLVACEVCGLKYPLTVEDAAADAPQLCVPCVRRAVLRPFLADVPDGGWDGGDLFF